MESGLLNRSKMLLLTPLRFSTREVHSENFLFWIMILLTEISLQVKHKTVQVGGCLFHPSPPHPQFQCWRFFVFFSFQGALLVNNFASPTQRFFQHWNWGVWGAAAGIGNARGCTIHRVASLTGFRFTCELIFVTCLSGVIFPIFLALCFGMLTLILERGRSVFDRFSLSIPCLVQAVGV